MADYEGNVKMINTIEDFHGMTIAPKVLVYSPGFTFVVGSWK